MSIDAFIVINLLISVIDIYCLSILNLHSTLTYAKLSTQKEFVVCFRIITHVFQITNQTWAGPRATKLIGCKCVYIFLTKQIM